MSHINGFLFSLCFLFSLSVSACVRLAGTLQNCLSQDGLWFSNWSESEGTANVLKDMKLRRIWMRIHLLSQT